MICSFPFFLVIPSTRTNNVFSSPFRLLWYSFSGGRGLLNAIVINQPKGGYGDTGKAWDLCVNMQHNGLLAKPTHGNIIRFAPPLTISEEEMNHSLDIIEKSVRELDA